MAAVWPATMKTRIELDGDARKGRKQHFHALRVTTDPVAFRHCTRRGRGGEIPEGNDTYLDSDSVAAVLLLTEYNGIRGR
jgi:hypothetical protein